MGLNCKPQGKMRSAFSKLENAAEKRRQEMISRKSEKQSKNKKK